MISSRLEICSEDDSVAITFSLKHSSGRVDVIERRIKTRSTLQMNLVNEKSSSNDLSRRGIVIKRFICTRSNLRKICQEKDLSSEYLSRRGVTSFKRFCRKRIVFEWFIKMVGCHQTYFQDVEMSLKDFPKRGFVIERFIKTRNSLRKSFEDG